MNYKEWLFKFGVVLVSIFAPASSMVFTALGLVLFDMITGVWAAHKRGEQITSSGLRRSVTKLFIYESAIVLAYLTQTYLTGPTLPVANIVCSLVGLTELLSCIENLNDISSSKLLTSVLERLQQLKK